MVLPRQPGLVVLLLLLLLWATQGCRSSPVSLATCPEACVCPDRTLINCSFSGLPLAPRHPSMDRIADLDISHNLLSSMVLHRPNAKLRALRLGDNQISYLALCLDKRSSDGGGRRLRSPGAWRNQRSQRCVSWAPGLLLLSMERNRLVETPWGLGGSRSLRVLQLSYNKISTLEAGDLEGLQQLKELHLHHNLISSLHSQAFMDLTNLTVIDLSFNLLTSISPETFLSPRVGLEIRGGGNPWRCDCDMASLKRWMALDADGDQRLWLDMVCSSPSSLAGRDLLQLHEEDLGCSSAQNQLGFHQDLTVDHGSTVLLPCSMQQGSTWWTPKGQVSANVSQTGLLISDITERDAGLYICVSQSHQDFVSVYNLKIREKGRLPRSLPGDSQRIGGNTYTGNTLGLAVGLSIFFTFLVAFILGIFARPCIDVLWQKVCGKKNASSQSSSVSSTGQGPYDNQAYSHEQDDPEIVSHRERRVTFSTPDNQEQSRVDYYDTLASGHPQNLPHTRHQSGEVHGRDSRRIAANSEPSLSQEFEHIPDDNKLGERRSVSSSSDEEQGNSTRTQKKSWKTLSSQPVDISIQQKTTDSVFTFEPLADCSPHLNDTKLTEQDQSNDSGEAFDFPESIQSGSARSSSLFESFNHSKKKVFPPLNDLRHSDRSSSGSSSHVSGDESMLYTVNPDTEEWERVEMAQDVQNIHDTKIIKGDVRFDKQTQSKQPIGIPLQEAWEGEQNAKMAPDHSDSSRSSSCESDDEVTEYTFNQGAADEDEENNTWPKLDLSNVTRIKRCLDIKVAETTGPAVTLKDTDQDYRYHVKPDIKTSTDFTSSSSDSEEETRGPVVNLDDTHVKTKVENAYEPQLHLGTVSPNKDFEINAREDRWPELDLGSVNRVKRHLDIKATTKTTGPIVILKDTDQDYRWTQLDLVSHAKWPVDIKASTDFTSSSSDSDEEPSDVRTKIEKTSPPIVHLGTVGPNEDSEINVQKENWPLVDLSRVTGVKRRLDIKVATPSPDITSSIGESGEDNRWPKLDLNNVTHIKRRLDIKVATETTGPAVFLKDTDQDYRWSQLDLVSHAKRPVDIKASTDFTSNSSDSDEEPTDVRTKIERTSPPIVHLGTVGPNKESEMNVQKENWPLVDLSRVTGVKRRLDIKVATPSPDITSSIGESGEDDRWPKLDLNNVTHIKRRLDIKVATETTGPAVFLKDTDQDYRWSQLDLVSHAKRPVDIKASTDFTSSSSDSDEEPTDVRTKIERTSPPIVHLGTVGPNKESEMNVQKENWPLVDLSRVTGVKRRLDIKVATPSPDITSSIGESGEDDRWPKLDLNNVTHIKRRLDIKVATETTGPAVILKDTDQDYRWSQLDLVSHAKRPVDIKASTDFTSSSSDSDEEPTDVRTKIERTSPPIVHLGTVGPNKESEMNVQKDNWPLVDLSCVTGVKRRLDIKVATETTGPAVTLKDTDQDYRYHVKPRPDIKASTDFTSSSSDSEVETRSPVVTLDDTYVKTKVENAYESHWHLGTVSPIKDTEINVQEDRWPGLDLGNAIGIKRRLDIKVATPSPDITSSINESGEDDRWPKLDLNNITNIKRRLDIKVATETTGPAVILKDTDQDYRWSQLDLVSHAKRPVDIKASTDFTSSSSDSDEEPSDVRTKIKKTSPPIVHLGTVGSNKESEMNVQKENWPLVDLSRVTGVKRRLDIKVATETTGPAVSTHKVENAYEPHWHLGTVKPIKDTANSDRWPELDLGNVTHVKRRLDIKAPTPSPEMTSSGSRVPLQSSFSSSSSDSESEAKVQTVKQERESPVVGTMSQIRWPDLNPFVPRIKKHLDVKAPSPTPQPVPAQNDTGSSSEVHVLSPTTKNESILNFKGSLNDNSLTSKRDPIIKLEKYAVITDGLGDNTTGPKTIPGREVTPDLESRWAGLNLGVSRFRKRLDISANKAAPLKVSSETEILSSSGERVDKSKEWDLKRGTVKELEIDAQNKTWPLVDLSRFTGVKRRFDIKVATPPPDISSSSESGEDDRWPKLDLDNITGIKRHLDIKVATLPSNTSDLSIEDRWKTQSRDLLPLLDALPPVPDCLPPDSSPSSESEDDTKRVSERTDFTEYRTHGPARSFAPYVRGTSEVASSFKAGDKKGWSSMTVDTQERKGLGALRALSSERKRWDTDHEELGAKWSSQQNKFQGLSLQDAPSLNYSRSGKDLEPHTSIISVQEARAPGRIPRSLQIAEYQNRLMGRQVRGEDTKVDLRHPPEYSELQNSTLFDLSNPMTEV